MNETLNGKEYAQILKEEMTDKRRTEQGPPHAHQGEQSRFSTSPPFDQGQPGQKKADGQGKRRGYQKNGIHAGIDVLILIPL
jgi:hypothetical protein